MFSRRRGHVPSLHRDRILHGGIFFSVAQPTGPRQSKAGTCGWPVSKRKRVALRHAATCGPSPDTAASLPVFSFHRQPKKEAGALMHRHSNMDVNAVKPAESFFQKISPILNVKDRGPLFDGAGPDARCRRIECLPNMFPRAAEPLRKFLMRDVFGLKEPLDIFTKTVSAGINFCRRHDGHALILSADSKKDGRCASKHRSVCAGRRRTPPPAVFSIAISSQPKN